MRLAGNLHRHKILDEFKFRPDQIIGFGVTCALVLKTYFTLSGAQVNLDRTSSNSGQIEPLSLELFAL